MQVNRSKIVISNNSQRKEIDRGVAARELVYLIGLKIFRAPWEHIWRSLAVLVSKICMGRP